MVDRDVPIAIYKLEYHAVPARSTLPDVGSISAARMNLPLYSSTADISRPSLVGLQHPGLAALPTQLVCSLRKHLSLTPLRVKIRWGDSNYVAACDLLRPINSSALKRVGELDAATSAEVLRTFQLLLASDE
jgi:mRNA-degrading endonuclease toxin of MazEF toxin-antitoxin module